MTGFRPPAPVPATGKQGIITSLAKTRRCPISALTEQHYRMKSMSIQLPFRRMLFINRTETIGQVFGDAERFRKSTLLKDVLELVLGDSIFVSNGETWKRQRRMMAPAFELARLKTVFAAMRGACDDSIARLKAADRAKPVEIDVEMTHVTADIIFRTIFSRALAAAEAHAIFDAFQRFQTEIFPYGVWRLLGAPRFFSYFRLRRCRRAAKDIRDILDPIVAARLAAVRSGEAQPEDILASLIGARDPVDGSSFDLRELCEQVAMLFLAGHETSSSGLSWALYLVAKSPEIQDRLVEESRAVMGGRRAEFSHMKRLALARNVFRETMRLYPPVSFIARDPVAAGKLRKADMSERDLIMVAPWVLHRHREYWQEADNFDPDRFDRKETEAAQRQAYMPFGMGPRVCLGAAFAMQEATLILADLVRHFRFSAVPGREPWPVSRLTLRSETGMVLMVEPREG